MRLGQSMLDLDKPGDATKIVIFGRLTGRDPRSLGENECAAYELGLSRPDVRSLQQVAFDQLAAEGPIAAAPLVLPKPVNPERCVHGK